MRFDSYALSIAGRRTNNEDAVCAQPGLGLFVVADGMGGYEGGEIASALAVEAILELVRRTAGDADVTWPYKIDPQRTITENELMVATRLAADRIAARRSGELRDMGSTVVALRLTSDGAVIAHVGDSRVYRLRGGALAQLTIDHSMVAQLEASGIKPDPSFPWRHVITRALGTATSEPEVQRQAIESGDVFLPTAATTSSWSTSTAPTSPATSMARCPSRSRSTSCTSSPSGSPTCTPRPTVVGSRSASCTATSAPPTCSCRPPATSSSAISGSPRPRRSPISPRRARKGRFAYMAPEQLAGEPITGAADQFGLGVTLVELVTGARPFAGETPWALLEAIRGSARLTGLAADLAAIAARTLAFDARDRYATVDDAGRAIAQAQRRLEPATAIELGAWVRARIAA